MWQYVYWLLWRYKFGVCALTAYLGAYLLVPEFAAFMVIFLPVVILAANATFSMQILATCGVTRVMKLRQALEISICTIGMAILGVILHLPTLLAAVPGDTGIGQAVAVVYYCVIAGVLLAMSDILLMQGLTKIPER